MSLEAVLGPPNVAECTTVKSATFYAPRSNRVIMPQSIANTVFSFPAQPKEYSFIMLYKPRIVDGHKVDPTRYERGQALRLIPIELLVVTGEGGGAEVTHDARRLGILNQFLDANHEYQFVDVHTHTESLGHYFAENFSRGDLRQYTENAGSVPGYLAALVTPTRIKFWPDNDDTRISLRDRSDIEQIFPGFTLDVAKARNQLTTIAGSRLDINYFLFE